VVVVLVVVVAALTERSRIATLGLLALTFLLALLLLRGVLSLSAAGFHAASTPR
jgi:hypothetical protein